MSGRIRNNISHKEFVLLGLISEFPSHAYSINQRIEERGMRNWTDIGKSSIYRIIGNLENATLIDYYEEEVDNRLRKVYSITTKGIEVLKEKILRTINEYVGRKDEDFYVAFSLLPILTFEEQIQAFKGSIQKVKKHKKELEEMLQENKKYPLNVVGLFKHPIMLLETDIRFLEWVLSQIRVNSNGVKNK